MMYIDKLPWNGVRRKQGHLYGDEQKSSIKYKGIVNH